MTALEKRAEAWREVQPGFQSMLFHLGCREVADITGVALGTIYDLANNTTSPHPRTIRDVKAAVDAFKDSDSERTV